MTFFIRELRNITCNLWEQKESYHKINHIIGVITQSPGGAGTFALFENTWQEKQGPLDQGEETLIAFSRLCSYVRLGMGDALPTCANAWMTPSEPAIEVNTVCSHCRQNMDAHAWSFVKTLHSLQCKGKAVPIIWLNFTCYVFMMTFVIPGWP